MNFYRYRERLALLMERFQCLLGLATLVALGCFLLWEFHHETTRYFSQRQGCAGEIVRSLAKAEEWVDVVMYKPVNEPVLFALEEARERGVKIRVAFDRSATTNRNDLVVLNRLKGAGFDVRIRRIVKTEKRSLVIDGTLAVLGAFNLENISHQGVQATCSFIVDPKVVSSYSRGENIRFTVTDNQPMKGRPQRS